MAQLPGWILCKKIAIQDTYVDADLVDFPLYVKIDNDADLHEARADGHDIRFTLSDGKTLLKYEREYWTGGNGSPATAHFWVKVPSIMASGGATIYIYYGKSDAPDGEDAPNVWDANFKGVWHFHEGSGTIAHDKSGVGNDGELQNMEEEDWVNGKINKALILDGEDEFVSVPHDESLMPPQITVEVWFNPGEIIPDVPGGNSGAGILGKSDWRVGGYWIGISLTDNLFFGTNVSGGSYAAYVTTSDYLEIGKWSRLAGTFDGSLVKLYVAGIEVRSVPGAMDSTPRPLQIGNSSQGGWAPVKGLIDEVRVSNIARPPAYHKFVNHNINEADNELTWGIEEGVYYGPGFPIAEKKKELLLIGERKPVFMGYPDDIIFIAKKKPILISEEID